jgi:23S rRNA (cytidine1920-2'-O)/16S rRNA (cytidine1409-2'-O)-methyltransferase
MRIDLYLVQKGYADSRTLAQKLIADGAVTVDGRLARKPSEDIDEGEHTVTVAATADTRYVGRGGLKLEAALNAFPVDVTGCVVADIGASTGGFTDCLLQKGAARVYAVDAGHGQLHPKLLADARVRSAEGMNARSLTPADLLRVEAEWQEIHGGADTSFTGIVDGIVMDVSFISQTLILPALRSCMTLGGTLVSLVKPQFELGKAALGKGGIVKNDRLAATALDKVISFASELGFVPIGHIPSPIRGGDGNLEFLAVFSLKTSKQ